MRLISAICACVLVAFAATPTSAQTNPGVVVATQVRPPARPLPRPAAAPARVRVFFLADSTAMSASQTFDALFETSRFIGIGGGGEVLRLYDGLFARAAFSKMGKDDGERVAVFEGDVFPLGIPLSVDMSVLEISAGWRFFDVPSRPYVPYAGAGLLRVGYKEDSDFAEPGDNASESFTGFNVFGGVELKLGRFLFAGVEAQYRSVADALGAGGVSEEFDETNLGGTTLRVMVGIRK